MKNARTFLISAGLAAVLSGMVLLAQQVQIPVPPVTPPPVTPPPMTVNVVVKPLPTGCTQGSSIYNGNTITATLNCGPPPPIIVTCNPATVAVGGSSSCFVTPTQDVTWSASAGSIVPEGVFTAPATAQTVTIKATSIANPTNNGTTQIVVTAQTACSGPFTLKPTGGVDNSTWLAKIAAAKGAQIEVCAGTYHFQPIAISNANFGCDDGVTLQDVAGYGPYQRMFNLGSNVTFVAIGPNKSCGFTMPFGYASNINNGNTDNNQYKHCIFVDGNATNVLLADFWMTKCGGDGLSVNNGSVTANNLNSNTNIRDGLAFTGAGTSTVNGGTYNANVNFANAGIATGIDAEMNTPTAVQHLTFNGVTTNQNGQDGTCLCLGQLWTNPNNDSTFIFNKHTSNGNATVPPPPGLHAGLPYRFTGWRAGSKIQIRVTNSIANGAPFSYSVPPQGTLP
jgi:hypothetical protein